MKKMLSVLLTIAMILCFTACGESNNQNPEIHSEEPQTVSPGLDQIRIGSASMGGGTYTIGNAIAQLINEKMDGIKGFNQETSGSGEDITLLESGEVEIGIVMGATLQQAVDGTGSFEGMPCKNISTIGTFKFDTYHVYTYTNAKINTISDLAGKKIGVGPMGGGIEVNANALLSAYGITPDDYTPIYGTASDMYEQLKVGQIDALIHCAAAGTSQPSDALASGKVSLLPIDSDKIDELMKTNRSFCHFTIAAGTYENQPEDIETMASANILVCRSDIDEESIYQFTKAFYENNEYLLTFYAQLTDAVPENASFGQLTGFHPGAERYLKEVGAI